MKILDMTAGRRHIWFNKKHPAATFIDVRPEVEPDLVASAKALPFHSKANFDLIVFDPPHCKFGKTSVIIGVIGFFAIIFILNLLGIHTGIPLRLN